MPQTIETLNGLFGAAVTVTNGRVQVHDPNPLAGAAMDALARSAVFDPDAVRDHARWMLWELGQAVGVRPASIEGLYMARGRGEVHGFTVPAINVRGMAYDTARAIFRTADPHEGRRVHPRDRALGDRVHRSAARPSTWR